MVQLTSQNQLNSRHLWMGLLGLDVHSRAQTPPNPPDFIVNRGLEIQAYVPMPTPPPSHSLEVDKASPPPTPLYWVNHSEDPYTAGKRHINICPHCSEKGHFGRECDTPHIYCANRGYCKIRERTECPYPRNHSRQGRKARKKRKKNASPSQDLGHIDEAKEPELDRSVELPA
jgi:hypothetical protein